MTSPANRPGDPPAFFGYEPLIARFRTHVANPQAHSVYDITAATGGGKTALLRVFLATAAEAGTGRVHYLDGQDYASQPPPAGDSLPGALSELASYLGLVSDLSRDIADDRFTEIGRRADELAGEAVERATALGPSFPIWADRKRSKLSREFVNCWNAVPDAGSSVILIDNFHSIIGQPMASWLLRGIAANLNSTVTVTARTATTDEFPYNGTDLVQICLTGLEPADIESYLAARLRRAAPHGSVTWCSELTGGHPGALHIIGDLVESNRDLPDTELAAMLVDLPLETVNRLSALVRRMLAVLGDAALDRTLRFGSVVRRFEPDLLERLVSPQDPDELRERVIPALLAYGFAEYHEATATTPGYYTLHELVRREMDRQLARDPTLYRSLHSKAEAWYAERWGRYGGTHQPAFYAALAQVEESGFQSLLREWLYHVPRATGTAEDARVHFAHEYFNAFWWYGWYERFELCDALVESLASEHQAWASGWHATLTAFADAYPVGPSKRGRGNWDEVRRALAFIREQTGLAGNVDELYADPDRRYVVDEARSDLRAVTDMLLAHSYRYRILGADADRSYREADRYYAEAQELFEALDDTFNIPWVLYERSDLDRERGRHEEALETLAEALGYAVAVEPIDQRDYEVIALCLRLRGDISFERGDTRAALGDYGRAVCFAYVFQAWPKPTDRYTAAFYREITGETVARLEQLNRDGQREEAWSACLQLHELWQRACASEPPRDVLPLSREAFDAGGVPAVRASLFPPEPPIEATGDSVAAYVTEATRVARAVVPSLLTDG